MTEDQFFNDWYSDHQHGLEDSFIENNSSDFNHWCMMCNREPDCPDAMNDYLETDVDRFWVFVRERFSVESDYE